MIGRGRESAVIEGLVADARSGIPGRRRHRPGRARIGERYDGPGGVDDFVRFAHEALGTLVRVRPTKIVALDRISEH